MARRGRKTQRQALFGEENSDHQPPPHETNAMTMERRNWSSLPELVVAIISNFLLSEDVTEYIRFRAVCPGWRQSTAPPSTIESLFRPRNWIMIISGKREKYSPRGLKDWSTFFNVSSGRCLLVNIPLFREGYTPISSADGLLVLLRRNTGELCLLHPFTLSITQLPKVDSLLSIMIRDEPSSVNFLSSSIVVFFFQRCHKVAFARIRGNRWFGTDYEVNCTSTLSFQGQLYAADHNTGELLQFELEEATIGPSWDPKLNVTTRIPTYSYPLYLGLLEYGGKMLLLRKCRDVPPLWGLHFEVYEIDVENRRLIPTTIPPDHTIFASESRCLSLPTSVSPSILPQSIYYYRRFSPDIDVYGSHRPNLAPTNSCYPHPEIIYRRTAPYPKNYIGPFSLSSYLISHCSNFLWPFQMKRK
ncbi:uncharacterized protein LOC144566173 isoform X2 [Carex rostrata]